MPDREVQTFRDLLFYQYAKLIARRAFAQPDGAAAKRQRYCFIKARPRSLSLLFGAIRRIMSAGARDEGAGR
jgi:hypothetical protein